MDILNKNLLVPYKIVKIHFFLHLISFIFCSLNYIYLLEYKQKYFFVTFVTFQSLLLIFILQILCVLKTSYFNTIDQLKCILNLYLFISLIFLSLIIIQYALVFQAFIPNNKYKIILLCFSLIYYLFDGFIFIFEYSFIYKQIKISIEERVLMQMNQNGTENKNIKNETRTSEKTNKNDTFVKESTVYIICENNNNVNNNNNKYLNNENNIFTEINNNNSLFNNEDNIIRIKRNSKRDSINNKFKTVNNPKRNIKSEESNSSKSFEQININLPINKKTKDIYQ